MFILYTWSTSFLKHDNNLWTRKGVPKFFNVSSIILSIRLNKYEAESTRYRLTCKLIYNAFYNNS